MNKFTKEDYYIHRLREIAAETMLFFKSFDWFTGVCLLLAVCAFVWFLLLADDRDVIRLQGAANIRWESELHK